MSEHIAQLFRGGRTIPLDNGQHLFRLDDPVRSMFLVAVGRVELSRYSATGTRMILHRATPGQVPAEASAYSPFYHCEGTSAGRSLVQAIPVGEFLERLEGAPGAVRAWAAQLAHSLQNARMNAEIRSLRRVDERLEAWLGAGRALPPKGQWQDLALAIGVTREALYRELAKRRGTKS